MKMSHKQRQNLQIAARNHPGILQHVQALSELGNLREDRLVEVVRALGINLQDAMDGKAGPAGPSWESDEGQALQKYSETNPAFKGVIEESVTISMFDQATTRPVRLSYEFTPEWPYYDLKQKKVMRGWPMSSVEFAVLHRVPASADQLVDGEMKSVGGKEYWKPVADLMDYELISKEMDEAIYDRIEEKCLRENAQRLRQAGLDF